MTKKKSKQEADLLKKNLGKDIGESLKHLEDNMITENQKLLQREEENERKEELYFYALVNLLNRLDTHEFHIPINLKEIEKVEIDERRGTPKLNFLDHVCELAILPNIENERTILRFYSPFEILPIGRIFNFENKKYAISSLGKNELSICNPTYRLIVESDKKGWEVGKKRSIYYVKTNVSNISKIENNENPEFRIWRVGLEYIP